MSKHYRYRSNYMPVEIPDILKLWLFRLLIPLGAHRQFICRNGFSEDSLAEALGLDDWIDPPTKHFDPQTVRAKLRKLHQQAERKSAFATMPPSLAANVARLAELVNLSDVDCRILEFAVLIHSERLLDDAADLLGLLSSSKVAQALSVLLDLAEPDIRSALKAKGTLARSGLVVVDRNGVMSLQRKLDLLSETFADHICSLDADPVALLRSMVAPAAPPELARSDYGHVEASLAVLRPYLRHALESGRNGVNVFIHGTPGTGKSQLAKVLAKEHGCELFEVASEDDDGDPVNGEQRLRAFRAAQSFFAQRRALIVFDEAEDVFNDAESFVGRKSTAQTRKGWINRMLEDNPVPTLWLSNSRYGLDPAFVRRFDMIVELPVPPKRQREQIIEQACSDLLDSTAITRIAGSESLAPAVVTRAAAVARAVQDEIGEAGAAGAFELLISNTLEAQGHKAILRHDPNRLPEIYDPAFIHADADLDQIVAGVVAVRSARLCLYGPPGTGKTAYARWLAEQLDVPLLAKRASDLMSMWVGENEQNIAHAFRQAEQEGALLLIDEVDSFLQDRRLAQRSWEVSLVNEMLTQMEAFAGVFIASTNLMQGLDQAALRRFDLKARFDYLTPEQGVELLRRYCETLSLAAPGAGDLARVRRLPNLTPGDFAAVMRQNRFRPLRSASGFIAALEAECTLKDGAKTAIGFIH